MSIKELPEWAINQNHPAFYDTESKTAIEMSAQLHGKMNEVIEEFNNLEDDNTKFKQDTEQANAEWKETTESAFRQEFQDFIDTVDLKVNGMQNEVKQEALNAVNEEVGKLSAELETEIDNTIQNKAKELQGTIKKVLVQSAISTNSYSRSENFDNYDLFSVDTTSIYYGMALELIPQGNAPKLSVILRGSTSSGFGANGCTYFVANGYVNIVGLQLTQGFNNNAQSIATIRCYITRINTTDGSVTYETGSLMNCTLTGYKFISEVET